MSGDPSNPASAHALDHVGTDMPGDDRVAVATAPTTTKNPFTRGRIAAAALIPLLFGAGYLASKHTPVGDVASKAAIGFYDTGHSIATGPMRHGGVDTTTGAVDQLDESIANSDSKYIHNGTGFIAIPQDWEGAGQPVNGDSIFNAAPNRPDERTIETSLDNLVIDGPNSTDVTLLYADVADYMADEKQAEGFVAYLFDHFAGTQIITQNVTPNEDGLYDSPVASARTLRGIAPGQNIVDYLNNNFASTTQPITGSLEVLVDKLVRSHLPRGTSEEDITTAVTTMLYAARQAEDTIGFELDNYATNALALTSGVPTISYEDRTVAVENADPVAQRIYQSITGTRSQMRRLHEINN